MQHDDLSIGQMAKINEVSQRALRIYQEKGLIEPHRVDEETGFRYYTLSQCATVDMIQQMKSLGFTLDEIKYLFDSGDVNILESKIREKMIQIEKERQRLELVQKMGQGILNNCTMYRTHPPFYEMNFEYLPERRIVRLSPIHIQPDNKTSHAVFDEWETTLRQIKEMFFEKNYPAFLFRNICASIPRENLISGDLRFGDALFFVDEFRGTIFEEAEIVPEGLFITTYCDSYSDEEGNFIEMGIVRKMLEHLTHEGYVVAGEYLGETIADTPVFCSGRQNMLARLQIPVKRVEVHS